MNTVFLQGRLGKDPETRTLQNGSTVANFSMCVSRKYKNAQGEYVDDNQWFNLQAWGKTGEAIQKWVKKGDQITIEGELRTRQYQSATGETRYATDIRVNKFHFGIKAGEGRSNEQTPQLQSEVDTSNEPLAF